MLEIDILPGYDGVSERKLRIAAKKFFGMSQRGRNPAPSSRWKISRDADTARANRDVNA
ncbi:hypothetical protein [Pseudolysobacter antarcticus]|uniref:hypothetical protein n=1 Tax=Pseudolysobacter antarcticus TaxID=2511995 RepID=UPI0013EC7559|nr:hypothetical protein [Pseudolysobacter antarcticus]